MEQGLGVRAGTCSMACWMAQEDVCRCMCGGRNHGLMRYGGEQPGRYRQRKGISYQLVAIASGIRAYREADRLVRQLREAAPQLEHFGFFYRDENEAFSEPVSGHALKWPECQPALDMAQTLMPYNSPKPYLVWARWQDSPAGNA